LVLGNADHHLEKGLHPCMICVQGSKDAHREFAIDWRHGQDMGCRARNGHFSDIVGSTTEQLDYNWHEKIIPVQSPIASEAEISIQM
jgi:hypothetical protein